MLSSSKPFRIAMWTRCFELNAEILLHLKTHFRFDHSPHYPICSSSALITELVQNMGEQSMTMQNTPLLMSRILGRGALLDPEVEVVTQQINGTHRQTLGKTWARANQVANALRAHGIKVGDRVGSFMWNNYYHLELYQGVPSMGSVLHTLNIRLSPADLEYIINHAGDKVIFADEDLLPLLEPLWGKIPCVELLVICRHGENGESSFENQIDYIESEKLDGCSTLSLIKGKGTIFPKFSSYFNPKFIAKIKNPFVHGSLIIKKEVFNAVNNYDENFYYTQDYKLTSDMLNNGYKIRVLNELLYISNTENNISSLHYFEQRNYAKQVRRENLKFWRTV